MFIAALFVYPKTENNSTAHQQGNGKYMSV